MNMKPIKITDETLKTVSGGRHEEQELIEARKLQEKLDRKTVMVTLHYKVEARDIADAINEQFDIRINRKSIELPEIKNTGAYPFKVKIVTGIVAEMTALVA